MSKWIKMDTIEPISAKTKFFRPQRASARSRLEPARPRSLPPLQHFQLYQVGLTKSLHHFIRCLNLGFLISTIHVVFNYMNKVLMNLIIFSYFSHLTRGSSGPCHTFSFLCRLSSDKFICSSCKHFSFATADSNSIDC